MNTSSISNIADYSLCVCPVHLPVLTNSDLVSFGESDNENRPTPSYAPDSSVEVISPPRRKTLAEIIEKHSGGSASPPIATVRPITKKEIFGVFGVATNTETARSKLRAIVNKKVADRNTGGGKKRISFKDFMARRQAAAIEPKSWDDLSSDEQSPAKKSRLPAKKLSSFQIFMAKREAKKMANSFIPHDSSAAQHSMDAGSPPLSDLPVSPPDATSTIVPLQKRERKLSVRRSLFTSPEVQTLSATTSTSGPVIQTIGELIFFSVYFYSNVLLLSFVPFPL